VLALPSEPARSWCVAERAGAVVVAFPSEPTVDGGIASEPDPVDRGVPSEPFPVDRGVAASPTGLLLLVLLAPLVSPSAEASPAPASARPAAIVAAAQANVAPSARVRRAVFGSGMVYVSI
jgi:hypothetical protein